MFAQSAAVPIHNHTVAVGTATGGISLLPARFRTFLGLYNDSGNVILCTVDDTNATATHGMRVPATSGQIVFESRVPRGSLRCYSATDGSLLSIAEGL